MRARPAAWVPVLLATTLLGCTEVEAPATFRVVELTGSPYERGLQHGSRFPAEIRSLYTRMLTSSILPFLNRERPDIAAVLTEYQGERYDDGAFSYELLLQSARSMEPLIPPELLEEMHGVADGAALPYEEILVLNTFLDSMLAMRAITFFIRATEAPTLLSVAFEGGLDDDGADNDGDGEVDEGGEGTLDPYGPSPHASLVEVPSDATVRFVLVDQAGAAEALGQGDGRVPEGVDPASIRIQLDTVLFGASAPEIVTRPVDTARGEGLEVVFTPPGGFPPASVVSLLLGAGDRSVVTDPPPAHARFMRDERIVFTTVGVGAAPGEVDSRGQRDGRTQPPSFGFAARGSATVDGAPILAHHYALLDANTAHEHTALFVHHADDGHDAVVLGWTGLVWGFQGMNDQGVSYGIFSSDTLDNGMMVDIAVHLSNLERARLLAVGVPIGMLGRTLLNRAGTAAEAAELLHDSRRTFGWNVLLADAGGDLLAVEMDSDILGDGGFVRYGPTEGSSVGADDLRLGCHFVANAEDVSLPPLSPQRAWSSFYYRSLRAQSILGDRVAGALGALDVASSIDVLSDPELVDPRDSMSAVVFEPAARRLHVAMGQVPATAGPFRAFALDDFFPAEDAP